MTILYSVPTQLSHKHTILVNIMLSSLNILDFTGLLPGPFTTKNLRDFGAQVLKIEHPTKKDLLDDHGQKVNNHSTLYHTLNYGKKVLKLDLKNQTSKEKIIELISTYDIIIEGFRPGVMSKFGLDYETLKEFQPNLIYCSITGYGQKGKYRDKPGHDINYLSLAGISSFSGGKETGPPNLGVQIADVTGSLYAINSILAAVIHRKETGKGAYIDLSLMKAALSLPVLKNNQYLNENKIPLPQDGILNGGSIYDYYKTSDNRYLAVGALENKFIRNLLKTLKIEQNANPFDPKLKQKIKSIISEKPLNHWIQLFRGSEACVEPVFNLDEVFNEKLANDLIEEIKIGENSIYRIKYPVDISIND